MATTKVRETIKKPKENIKQQYNTTKPPPNNNDKNNRLNRKYT